MTRVVLTILAAALFCSVTHVQASPITYSLTSTATGTLGLSSFTDAVVTVTLTGDTANVMPFGPIVFNTGAATVSVGGLGTATFTDPIEIFSTLNDLAIFGVPAVVILDGPIGPGTGILLQTGSVFSSYDLRGPLGPVSGPGGVASGSHMTPIFPTTAGDLTWAIGQSLGTSTFTAIVTPEPGTMFLLGSGLAAVLARGRHQKMRLTR